MTRLGFWTGRSALLFLAVVLSFSSVLAQTPDSTKPVRPNALKAGAWALQFQITQDFTLNAFQGLLLSAKNHFTNRSAIRFGVGFSATSSDVDNLNRQLAADTLREERENVSNGNSQSFDFAVQYLLYTSP